MIYSLLFIEYKVLKGLKENIWIEEGRKRGGWRKPHDEELNDLYSSPNWSWGSSVSIVSDYRLYEPGSIPGLCVQTNSEAHPASYPIGTGGLSPGVKRPRRDTNHSE
jgi:hypothetical protein